MIKSKDSGVMKTRMEKYYDEENNNIALRQRKNEKLYQNINDYDVDDYKIEANATVIDTNAKNIDVEKIKKILDTKYNKQPQRKSIVIEEEESVPDVNLDETREYDINAILERARSEKEVDYEKERLKKLRDTQYDILNSLEITEKEDIEEQNDELMSLINTITANELDEKKASKEELDPLDILTDLKGSDDTVVVDGVHEEEESANETAPIMSLEEADKIKPSILENKSEDLTETLQFTQSDFDDFNDLKKEVRSSRALIYIIIVMICLILIAGVIIFFNNFLNLSIF